MPKPDVELVHAETGHIYYNGKVYDVTRMANGWVLTRPFDTVIIHTGQSIDDSCAWLICQRTQPTA